MNKDLYVEVYGKFLSVTFSITIK